MESALSRLPRALLMGLVRAYRLLLSPALRRSCRFEPSCSAYALQALERHGAAAGSYLAVARLARCHPWCEPGFDPVPEPRPGHSPALFSRWLSDAPVRRVPAPSSSPDKNFP